MKATPVNAILRHSAFALALLGGAAITAAPASANSVDNEGYFGAGARSARAIITSGAMLAASAALWQPRLCGAVLCLWPVLLRIGL
jgi:hypothetical protein